VQVATHRRRAGRPRPSLLHRLMVPAVLRALASAFLYVVPSDDALRAAVLLWVHCLLLLRRSVVCHIRHTQRHSSENIGREWRGWWGGRIGRRGWDLAPGVASVVESCCGGGCAVSHAYQWAVSYDGSSLYHQQWAAWARREVANTPGSACHSPVAGSTLETNQLLLVSSVGHGGTPTVLLPHNSTLSLHH